jgi:hypothetical protein
MESKTSDEAKKLGLDYMKFGRWGKDGKVTHVSKDDKLVPKDTAGDDMVAKGPTNPDTAMIGKTKVNTAPQSIVNKTSVAGPRDNPKQDFGAHFIDSKKAAKFLPAILKKLTTQHPNSSIRIEPVDGGFNLFQEPSRMDSQPIGGDAADYDPNDAALKPRDM